MILIKGKACRANVTTYSQERVNLSTARQEVSQTGEDSIFVTWTANHVIWDQQAHSNHLMRPTRGCLLTLPGLAALQHLRLIIETSMLGSYILYAQTARTPGRFNIGQQGDRILAPMYNKYFEAIYYSLRMM